MTVRVLVFHRALGFVHQSIPDAVAAVEALGASEGWAVEATDDPDQLAGRLVEHDVALFVHTSGDVLPDETQRRSLEQFVHGGGGFVGVHAASAMGDVAQEWPWYRDLVGASFKGHTVSRLYADEPLDLGPSEVHAGPCSAAPSDAEWIGNELAMHSCEAATVHVEAPGCPAVDGIDDGALLVDEWYGFHDNPRPRVNVAATVDEQTYEAHLGGMGADHPIVWWRDVGRGRSVYNAMGHAALTWSRPDFLRSIAGGIRFAADRRSGGSPAR